MSSRHVKCGKVRHVAFPALNDSPVLLAILQSTVWIMRRHLRPVKCASYLPVALPKLEAGCFFHDRYRRAIPLAKTCAKRRPIALPNLKECLYFLKIDDGDHALQPHLHFTTAFP